MQRITAGLSSETEPEILLRLTVKGLTCPLRIQIDDRRYFIMWLAQSECKRDQAAPGRYGFLEKRIGLPQS